MTGNKHEMVVNQSLQFKSPQWMISRMVFIVLLVIQAAAFLILLQRGWQALSFPYPLDYGEGLLLDQTVRLSEFQNIYQVDLTVPPYVFMNYPPLYVMLQVPFVWLAGPAYWYGRAISLVSILFSALLIGSTLYSTSKDRLAAAVGGLTFLAIPYVLVWSSLNRVDSLALALSWSGLFVIVNWSNRRWALAAGAFFLTAAIFTRQTYGLAAPLAAFVWLCSQRSLRDAILLAVLTGCFSLGLFLFLNWDSQGGYFFSVVTTNVNEYSLERVYAFTSRMVRYMPFLLLSSLGYIILGLKNREATWWLVWSYLAGSSLVALTIGKIGSNVNYFYELSAALSLAAGALIAKFSSKGWWRVALVSLLAFQVAYLIFVSMSRYGLDWVVEQEHEIKRLQQIVNEAKGPVLADEYMGLLPLVSHSLYIEPIGMKHLVRAGLWDQSPLIEAVRQREFEVILIYPIYAAERWTPQTLAQIEASYVPVATYAETIVYRAR